MANIVVTGSLGTLGRPLVRALQEQEHNVFEIDLMHNGAPRFFRADISNYRELINALSMIDSFCQQTTKHGIDYVFHLAAEFGRMNGELFYDKLWSTNAVGTKNILEAQKGGIFDKLVFFSSSEVYGETQAESLSESLMDELSIVQHNDYAISKWVNEKQIMNHEKRTGLPVMRVRLFNAYGPGEYYHPFRSVVCLFCYRALRNIPYQVYEGYHRVFMYVDDLIPSLTKCVGMFTPGMVINIGGEEYRSVRELSDIVLKNIGRDDSLVEYLPEDKHNTLSKKPNIELAKKVLGHNPTITLEEGVPKTIAWMRDIYGVTE